MRETIELFKDGNTGDVYVTRYALERFELDPLDKIYRDGTNYYRVDNLRVYYIIKNKDNEFSPYDVVFKDLNNKLKMNIDIVSDAKNTNSKLKVNFTTRDEEVQEKPKSNLVFKFVSSEEELEKPKNNSLFNISTDDDLVQEETSNNLVLGEHSNVDKNITEVLNDKNKNDNMVSLNSLSVEIDDDENVFSRINYGKYQKDVEEILTRVFRDSKDFYINPSNKTSLTHLYKYINFLNYYFNYYYMTNIDSFDDILNTFGNPLYFDKITEFDDMMNGKYSINEVSINKNLINDNKSLMRSLSHELGHVINSIWSWRNDSFNDEIISKGNMISDYKPGIELLDEVTAQDRAEDIVSYYSGLERKRFISKSGDPDIYDGETFITNFDSYGELQEPAIMFARTLDDICDIKDDEDALRTFSTRALSPDFLNNIISEYRNNYSFDDYYKVISLLSPIKSGYDAKMYGTASKKTSLDMKKARDSLKVYTSCYDGSSDSINDIKTY